MPLLRNKTDNAFVVPAYFNISPAKGEGTLYVSLYTGYCDVKFEGVCISGSGEIDSV